MANIVETFTGTNGAVPSGWTATGSGSATIQSNAFRIVSPATGTYVTERASRAGLANGDAVYDVLISTLTEHYPEIVVRSSSATAYANGYALNLLPADGLIEISELTAGARAALGSNAAFTFVAGNTYRVRFRWSGSTLKAKVWLASGSEPGGAGADAGWMITTSDASVTAAGTLHLCCTSGAVAGARTTTFDTLTVTDLDAGAVVDMTGTAPAASSATGTLVVSRGVAGTAPAASGATGTLAAARDLSGVAPAASAATGALQAARPLSGAAAAASGAAGEIATVRPLSGVAAAASSASGSLTVTPARASVAALRDDFATQDPARWQYGPAGIAATGGQLVIDCTTGYPTLISTDTDRYLTGSEVVLRVAAVPAVGTGTTQSYWGLTRGGGNELQYLVEGGQLKARAIVAGVPTLLGSATLDLVAHRWQRIRESGGTITWDTSPDLTTWSTLATAAAPFTTADGYGIYAGAGYYGTETAPGSLVLDDVNPLLVAGAAASASSASGTLAVSRPLTGTAPAASSATGALDRRPGLIGTAAAASAARGDLIRTAALTGTAPAASGATGVLARDVGITGTAAAASGARGSLTGVGSDLAGVAAAASSASGELRVSRPLSGVAAAASSAAGELVVNQAAQPLPLPDDPLPPRSSGWRPRPVTPYRPPTVIYV